MLSTRLTTLAGRADVGEGSRARGGAVVDAVADEYGEGTSPARPGWGESSYGTFVLKLTISRTSCGWREMM
jgi:hypothetical protein